MEISHASTETQAVAIDILGEAEEVTVSTDADFMMMIAHGIYSNKALALVRELLCNARDGHFKAGTPDAYIQVTLTDNKLVVRDHGTGIPNNVFTKIYMTFGASTKRKSKGETGGFGVGSKVPWAVTDTFSARNWFEGIMTAYSIMKSDPKKNGKPSCTPVVSVPSTEPSGVEVTVPFPEKMRNDINAMILHFNSELGLNIELNGTKYEGGNKFNPQEMDTLGYTRIPSHPKTVIQTALFYVHLGDVIYPIECQPEFEEAWGMVSQISFARSNQPMIFRAKPDSIVPTLSRESLQYTEQTIQSILDLFKKPLQDIAEKVDEFATKAEGILKRNIVENQTFIRNFWTNSIELETEASKNASELYLDGVSNTLNSMILGNFQRWLGARTPYVESQNIVGKTYREALWDYVNAEFEKKLDVYPYIKKGGLLEIWKYNQDRHANQAKRKEFIRNAWEEVMFWDQEARTNPLISNVYFAEDDDIHRAVSASTVDSYFIEPRKFANDPVKEKALDCYDQFMNIGLYLTKTVVISTTMYKMVQRAREKFKQYTDQYNPLMPRGDIARLLGARFVRVKPSIRKADVDLLAKQIKDMGYEVIILLDPTAEERAEADRLAAERAALREIPLPTLGEMIRNKIMSDYRNDPTNYRPRLRRLNGILTNKAYKGKAHYFILPRGKELPYGMRDLDEFMKLVRFTGTDIICVSTKMEIARVIKEGRISVDDTILECVKLFYKTPGLHDRLYYENTTLSKLYKKNRVLTKYLFNRDIPELTLREKKLRTAFRELAAFMPVVRKYMDMKSSLYSVCPPDEHYQKLFRDYGESHFCHVDMAIRAAYSDRPSPKRALARSILKAIVKG